ncbi:hypothetical protein ACKVAX_21420 [Klebsiella pasteurii]|uniref:hypothetical protein n=1 Tax=Klebsiella pasteurii TaxID=2587529 RepID=UPI003F1974C7
MTSKLTREQVIALITEHSYDSALVDALEYLLAAMDSEPVAEVCEDYAIRYISSGPAPKEGLHPGDKLYRHAQQPVVPPMQHWEELCREHPDMSIGDAIIRAAWWNHCRAAMLNGGKS